MSTRRTWRPPLRRVSSDERLSVVEHLTELRNRLVVALIGLVVAFGVAYAMRERIFDILLEPLPAGAPKKLTTFSPQEAFFTSIKVAAGAALLLALPLWLYQLYAFVIPAVRDQPRKRMLAVVGAVSLLFLGGVAFGYFVILPISLDFLYDFATESFDQQYRAEPYFAFVMMLLLATGFLFEVPVAMIAFARMGVISAAGFRKGRRHAIVVIAVIAAVLPGGDPFTMLLLMAPQLVLYEAGILLAGLVERRTAAQEPSAEPSPSA